MEEEGRRCGTHTIRGGSPYSAHTPPTHPRTVLEVGRDGALVAGGLGHAARVVGGGGWMSGCEREGGGFRLQGVPCVVLHIRNTWHSSKSSNTGKVGLPVSGGAQGGGAEGSGEETAEHGWWLGWWVVVGCGWLGWWGWGKGKVGVAAFGGARRARGAGESRGEGRGGKKGNGRTRAQEARTEGGRGEGDCRAMQARKKNEKRKANKHTMSDEGRRAEHRCGTHVSATFLDVAST